MVEIEGELITMTVSEYENLLRSEAFENAFRQNGVDNWDWYDEAMISYREELESLGLD